MDPAFLIIADSTAIVGDAIKVLTGAGGAILIAYKWIQRESDRADKAQARVDEISDKAITALTEVSIYLADTSKHLESVGGVVHDQHGKTRQHVSDTISNLRPDGQGKED